MEVVLVSSTTGSANLAAETLSAPGYDVHVGPDRLLPRETFLLPFAASTKERERLSEPRVICDLTKPIDRFTQFINICLTAF